MDEDIGSAFCTQEQRGISICERVSDKERIGGGCGSRCHQPGTVSRCRVGKVCAMPKGKGPSNKWASTHTTHTHIYRGLAWVLGEWCTWFLFSLWEGESVVLADGGVG